MSNVIIDLKNIDITFTQKRRTIQAVKDVSIQIEKGDIYGIVGYSGAVNDKRIAPETSNDWDDFPTL